MDPQYERLVAYIRGQAGDTLRGVLVYDESGWQPLHVREDLATEQLEESLSALHSRFVEQAAFVSEDEYPPLGPVQATAELHEQAVLLHFSDGTARGVVVTLDPEAGQQLMEFVSQCTEFLEDSE